MQNNNNGIYYIVDEDFIRKFKNNHIEYMKDFYYKNYTEYCKRTNGTILKKEIFFTNMRRRRIKVFQVCCPYCGYMNVLVLRKKIDDLKRLNFCWHCGKSSVSYNVFSQLSSFERIVHFHSLGLKIMDEMPAKNSIEIMTYEVFHLELIQITSILEVILRDFFGAFININYLEARDDYISKLITKNVGNDFMNIEKANNHYKKALNINLRSYIDNDKWNDLIDLVNIRNTLVHNNGIVDDKFKNTKTFLNVKECIKGDLIFINKELVNKYFLIVKIVADIIGNLFMEKYSLKLHELIANFYFNQSIMDLDDRKIK